MFGKLKFDKMVDTERAKKYMESNDIYLSLGYSNTDEYEIDNCGNKIMFADCERNTDLVTTRAEKQDSVKELSNKLKALAKLVEENQVLFAQIDYMVRKKTIKESLNIDLKLIVQNIIYVSSVMTRKIYSSNVLVMQGGSPLCMLGVVAQLVCGSQHLIVKAVSTTAVLCHLFVTLCRKAGLAVRLAFVKEPLTATIQCDHIKELQRGCICVITERSDVESAVDTFIASASQDPWRIRRVLVQESIVERLKQILEWKSKLNSSKHGSTITECSNFYLINDRHFLFEYTGQEQSDHVIIEAFRTVKELLSLSTAYKPFAVSLWSADVSQANEIAHGLDANFVWINDYVSFYGPPKSSQAFYSIIDILYARKLIQYSYDFKILDAYRNNWMKLDVVSRCNALNLALKKVEIADISKSFDGIDLDLADGNFVEVSKVGICVGLEMRALPVVFLDKFEIKEVLERLLKGFEVVFCQRSAELGTVLSVLEESGAPLVYREVIASGESLVTTQCSPCTVKVVRTTLGTIFAN